MQRRLFHVEGDASGFLSLARLAGVLVAVLLVGCEGDVEVGSGGSGSAGTTTHSSSVASTTASGATTSAGTTGATTGAASSGTGAGTANVDASVQGAEFYIDCAPGSPGGDPIHGSLTAFYENKGTAPGSVDVKDVSLTLEKNGSKLTWVFSVTPASSGVLDPGAKATIDHAKVEGSGMGTPNVVSPCAMCGGTWDLGAAWSDGTTGIAAVFPLGPIQCAF